MTCRKVTWWCSAWMTDAGMTDCLWLNAKEGAAVLATSGVEGLGRHERLGSNANLVSLFFPETSLVLQLHSVRSLTVEALRVPFWKRGFIPPMEGYRGAGLHGNANYPATVPTPPAGTTEAGSTTQDTTVALATVPVRPTISGAHSPPPVPVHRLPPLQVPTQRPSDSSSNAESPFYVTRPETPTETNV